MPDMFSKEKRSEIMSHIKGQNTAVELKVFSYLRKNKIYFQKHYSKAPGKPDIALPRKKIAIFIDGDFWHGRNFAKIEARLPNTYWKEKIKRNMERDEANGRLLKKEGWKTLRVWQTDIEKHREESLLKIRNFLLNKK